MERTEYAPAIVGREAWAAQWTPSKQAAEQLLRLHSRGGALSWRVVEREVEVRG